MSEQSTLRTRLTENRDVEYVSPQMAAAANGEAVVFPMPQEEQLPTAEQPKPTQPPEPPAYPTEAENAEQNAGQE